MARTWIGTALALWFGVNIALAQETRKAERGVPLRPSMPATGVPLTAQTPAEPVPVVPARDGEHRHVRVVIRLRGAPAMDLAAKVNELLRGEGHAVPVAAARNVMVVPEPVSNSLLVGGPPEAVEEVERLVDRLDQPAVMVRLEVLIVEVPAGKVKVGTSEPKAEGRRGERAAAEPIRLDQLPEQTEILARAQLTTLSNQPAFIQMGRREPRITGSTKTATGTVNSVTVENVGTIVGLTPRVGADRAVTINVDIEDSRAGPAEQGTPIAVFSEGETVRMPNVDTLKVQTTLRIPDGQTVVASGMAREAKSGKERLILVTPHVLRMEGEGRARR